MVRRTANIRNNKKSRAKLRELGVGIHALVVRSFNLVQPMALNDAAEQGIHIHREKLTEAELDVG